MLAVALDTKNFDFGHFMAGITAVIAAFASLAGGLAALGFTKKQATAETKAVATDDCEKRVERMNEVFDKRIAQMMEAFERGADVRDA